MFSEYQQYLTDFDPTPDYLYDGYKTPLSYEDWLEEQLDAIGLY